MDLYLSFIQTLFFLQTCVWIKERYKSMKIWRRNRSDWSQFVAAFSPPFLQLIAVYCRFLSAFFAGVFERMALWFWTRKRLRRRHSFTTSAPWRLTDTQMELKAFEAAQQTVSSAYRWKAGTGIIPTKVTMLYSQQQWDLALNLQGADFSLSV